MIAYNLISTKGEDSASDKEMFKVRTEGWIGVSLKEYSRWKD